MESPRPSSVSATAPLGARDCAVLGFAAEHRLVLAAQVAVLLGVSAPAAGARLRALTRARCLRQERKLAGPGCWLIERRGLAAIASPLPRPRDLDLATYRHDVGLGWLWLAAGRGAFGGLEAMVSERQMRSHDGRTDQPDERYGVRLPGPGPRGGERRHYPDLLLECRTGHRVAVELELTAKPRRRLQEILGGYAIDRRMDAVLYLVENRSIGQAVERAASTLGIEDMIHVQMVALGAPGGDRVAPDRMLSTTRGAPEPQASHARSIDGAERGP